MYICIDCNKVTHNPHQYVGGATRCNNCASIFNSNWRERQLVAERAQRERIRVAHLTSDTCEEDKCQECCPHDEHDHGICLDCAKDLIDELSGVEYEVD